MRYTKTNNNEKGKHSKKKAFHRVEFVSSKPKQEESLVTLGRLAGCTLHGYPPLHMQVITQS